MYDIKPIETIYSSYKFRSRLEARWAVFFDALDVRYEYEAEGFDLGAVWYLPDFWLPERECFVEIKPFNFSPQNNKCELLSKKSGRRVLLAAGTPRENGYRAELYTSHEDREDFMAEFAGWAKAASEYNDLPFNFLTGSIMDFLTLCPNEFKNKILNAYRLASMARF